MSEKERVFYKPKVNFIPSNLDFDNWLSDQKLYGFHKFSKDVCAQLISNIYTAPVYNKKLREQIDNGCKPFFNLNSKILYAQTKEYTKYVDLLVQSGVWESDNTFEIGKKSIGYRFTENYKNVPYKLYHNYQFGQRVNENESISASIKESTAYSDTVVKLIDDLKHLKLDYRASLSKLHKDLDNQVINIDKFNYTACSIEKIHSREYFAIQDKYGRLHTNLTNLKKEHRNYLTVENHEKLVSIDLKNSQPFFSTLLLDSGFWENKLDRGKITLNNLQPTIINNIVNKDSIIMFTKSVEDNDDVLMFIDLVVSGNLYEFFLKHLNFCGIACENRKNAKTEIFKVFFSKQLHLKNCKSAQIFKKLFPSIYELFRLVKVSNNNTLALVLQSIESHVFIEEIAKNFMQKFPQVPIFTIHDSILVPLKKAISAKWFMINYIKSKTTYRPTLDFELLKSES